VTGAVAFGVGERRDRSGLAITITATEDKHWKRLAFQFVPVNCYDLPSNELLIMLAFDLGGLSHAASPT